MSLHATHMKCFRTPPAALPPAGCCRRGRPGQTAPGARRTGTMCTGTMWGAGGAMAHTHRSWRLATKRSRCLGAWVVWAVGRWLSKGCVGSGRVLGTSSTGWRGPAAACGRCTQSTQRQPAGLSAAQMEAKIRNHAEAGACCYVNRRLLM
eukprot:363429-Chlamydomonas_euryale.AAC.9